MIRSTRHILEALETKRDTDEYSRRSIDGLTLNGDSEDSTDSDRSLRSFVSLEELPTLRLRLLPMFSMEIPLARRLGQDVRIGDKEELFAITGWQQNIVRMRSKAERLGFQEGATDPRRASTSSDSTSGSATSPRRRDRENRSIGGDSENAPDPDYESAKIMRACQKEIQQVWDHVCVPELLRKKRIILDESSGLCVLFLLLHRPRLELTCVRQLPRKPRSHNSIWICSDRHRYPTLETSDDGHR